MKEASEAELQVGGGGAPGAKLLHLQCHLAEAKPPRWKGVQLSVIYWQASRPRCYPKPAWHASFLGTSSTPAFHLQPRQRRRGSEAWANASDTATKHFT